MGKSTFVHADDVMPPREAGKQQAAANKSAGKPSSHNNAKYAKRNGDTHRKKHKKGKNTSLSLEAFARAGKSTYDKREVVKKRRAEMAAKINKFRKVVKRAGDFVEPTEGFDPEEYARKLTKMEDSFIGDGLGLYSLVPSSKKNASASGSSAQTYFTYENISFSDISSNILGKSSSLSSNF